MMVFIGCEKFMEVRTEINADRGIGITLVKVTALLAERVRNQVVRLCEWLFTG